MPSRSPAATATQTEARRIEGADLDQLRQALGLDVLAAQFLYGKSMLAWSKLTDEEHASQPVRSGTLSLLVRYLTEHPEESFIPRFPTPQEVLDTLRAYEPDLTLHAFSLLLGREVTAGYRWIEEQRAASPEQQRLMRLLVTALRKRGHTALLEWRQMCELEARAGGSTISGVTGAGRRKPRKRRNRARSWSLSKRGARARVYYSNLCPAVSCRSWELSTKSVDKSHAGDSSLIP